MKCKDMNNQLQQDLWCVAFWQQFDELKGNTDTAKLLILKRMAFRYLSTAVELLSLIF